MTTHSLGSQAVLLLAGTTMTVAVDPVFMTGIVAICAIVVFSLTIIAVVIFGDNEGTARAALKALVELWRLVWG